MCSVVLFDLEKILDDDLRRRAQTRAGIGREMLGVLFRNLHEMLETALRTVSSRRRSPGAWTAQASRSTIGERLASSGRA